MIFSYSDLFSNFVHTISGTIYFRYKYIMKIIYTSPKYEIMKKGFSKNPGKKKWMMREF